ncbi:MAG: F0F1 ATP synthase subunit epsilon [Calditrichaceae bacterium]
MTSELELEIVTPFGVTYSEKVNSCVVPGEMGQFQILNNHAPLVSVVKIGVIKIEKPDGKILYLATNGGFCEVKDNVIKVIVESAELAESIDVARAEYAKKRAAERLASHASDIDYERVRFALERAINRLKVSELK